ncbi:MAG: penicillin-binding protein activator LpoB, partial [Treponema sp.]|nr:penicillin-binding protein activator LpoB [Treponema sp.]
MRQKPCKKQQTLLYYDSFRNETPLLKKRRFQKRRLCNEAHLTPPPKEAFYVYIRFLPPPPRAPLRIARFSFNLLLLLFVPPTAGFAKDNLAILPFTGGQGDEGETIAELFSFEPALTAMFDPVPRTSINRAIRSEQRFQYESGMTDPDTAAALGKQLGARYVVSGSITALGRQ